MIVNANKDPVNVWTKLPARSLFAHPAANGNVGVVWRSPVAAKIRITGRIKDAHPGGHVARNERGDTDAKVDEHAIAQLERDALGDDGLSVHALQPWATR